MGCLFDQTVWPTPPARTADWPPWLAFSRAAQRCRNPYAGQWPPVNSGAGGQPNLRGHDDDETKHEGPQCGR